jgi:microcystin-dependent protein
MSQPYVGEIRIFAGNFAPSGWAFCQGQILPISGNEVLFNLIGTTYGGDGQSTFALPDLGSRVPVHMGVNSLGSSYTIGQSSGVETVTLTTQQIPAHNHLLEASSAPATTPTPSGNVVPAAQTGGLLYAESAPDTAMASGALVTTGGNQPHTNIQPYLALNFIISMFGVFPSQT